MATARFFYKDPDAPSPNRPISVGVLALIERAGALLMDRRSDCGRWGLPGGAVAPDEALEAALVREVREETGLTVTDCELFCISADPSRIASYPDGNVVRIVTFAFTARVENFSKFRASEESEELTFLRRDELRWTDVIETARPIVERYLS
jgi:8-oxo-dGTP pyrophosphatase MutT (NUDIX family)